MAERTVRSVVTSYVHTDGSVRPGLRGEVVQVHPDHLAAFDKQEDAATPVAAEIPDMVEIPQEPPRAGKGSGLNAWSDYASTIGLEVPDDASRDDVISLVDAAHG